MWAGKYKTTSHGSLIIGDEFGNIIFVSDPDLRKVAVGALSQLG
jgi:hypothetical protein